MVGEAKTAKVFIWKTFGSPLNSTKDYKKLKSGKKYVIFTMICCRGNSLQHDDIMLAANAFNINSKIKQIVRPQSIIPICVFMFLNTKGANLISIDFYDYIIPFSA